MSSIYAYDYVGMVSLPYTIEVFEGVYIKTDRWIHTGNGKAKARA